MIDRLKTNSKAPQIMREELPHDITIQNFRSTENPFKIYLGKSIRWCSKATGRLCSLIPGSLPALALKFIFSIIVFFFHMPARIAFQRRFIIKLTGVK
jgi:hypothetical protein